MTDEKNNIRESLINKAPNYLSHNDSIPPYTRILNHTIDLIHDDAALGIFVYLSSKPEDWVIQEKDLMNRFKRGRDHIRKCLAILKDLGLLKKIAVRNEKGHVIAWRTILYSQITENPSCGDVQITENPTSGKIHLLDNPTHTNKRNIEIKEKEIQTNAFDRFWNEYPRKVGKKEAQKKWKSLKLDDHIEKILEKVALQKENDWKGKDLQYIPHASTYLNQARWEDEIEPSHEERLRQQKIQKQLDAEKRQAEQERLSQSRMEQESQKHTQYAQDRKIYRAITSEVKKGSSKPSAEFQALAKRLRGEK